VQGGDEISISVIATKKGAKKGERKSSTSSATVGSTENAANEFSQRMQRDQRFKKSADATTLSSENAVAAKKPLGGSKSPTRSPLAPVKHDGNSPLVRSASPMKKGEAGKRCASPMNNRGVDAKSTAAAGRGASPMRKKVAGADGKGDVLAPVPVPAAASKIGVGKQIMNKLRSGLRI